IQSSPSLVRLFEESDRLNAQNRKPGGKDISAGGLYKGSGLVGHLSSNKLEFVQSTSAAGPSSPTAAASSSSAGSQAKGSRSASIAQSASDGKFRGNSSGSRTNAAEKEKSVESLSGAVGQM